MIINGFRMKFAASIFLILLLHCLVPAQVHSEENVCTNIESFSKHFATLAPYTTVDDTTNFNIPTCEAENLWFVVGYGGSDLANDIEEKAKRVKKVQTKILSSKSNKLCTADHDRIKDWAFIPQTSFPDNLVNTYEDISKKYVQRYKKLMKSLYNSTTFQFEYNRNVPQVNETFTSFLQGWLGYDLYRYIKFPENGTILDLLKSPEKHRNVPDDVVKNVKDRMGTSLEHGEILDLWDMCRSQSIYKNSETSSICLVFDETDVKLLEDMEFKSLEENLEPRLVALDYLKKDFQKNLPIVSSFFTVPTAFRLLLNVIGIKTQKKNINEFINIAANLVIVKYKCDNATTTSHPLRFFLNEQEVFSDACQNCTLENFKISPEEISPDNTSTILWSLFGVIIAIVIAGSLMMWTRIRKMITCDHNTNPHVEYSNNLSGRNEGQNSQMLSNESPT